MQLEFPALQRAAQPVLDMQVFADPVVDFAGEKTVGIPATALGVIERGIRMSQQGIAIVAVTRKNGDTQRRRHAQVQPVKQDRRRHIGQQLLGQLLQHSTVRKPRQDQHELVAAITADRVAGPHPRH